MTLLAGNILFRLLLDCSPRHQVELLADVSAEIQETERMERQLAECFDEDGARSFYQLSPKQTKEKLNFL